MAVLLSPASNALPVHHDATFLARGATVSSTAEGDCTRSSATQVDDGGSASVPAPPQPRRAPTDTESTVVSIALADDGCEATSAEVEEDGGALVVRLCPRDVLCWEAVYRSVEATIVPVPGEDGAGGQVGAQDIELRMYFLGFFSVSAQQDWACCLQYWGRVREGPLSLTVVARRRKTRQQPQPASLRTPAADAKPADGSDDNADDDDDFDVVDAAEAVSKQELEGAATQQDLFRPRTDVGCALGPCGVFPCGVQRPGGEESDDDEVGCLPFPASSLFTAVDTARIQAALQAGAGNVSPAVLRLRCELAERRRQTTRCCRDLGARGCTTARNLGHTLGGALRGSRSSAGSAEEGAEKEGGEEEVVVEDEIGRPAHDPATVQRFAVVLFPEQTALLRSLGFAEVSPDMLEALGRHQGNVYRAIRECL